MREHSKRGGLSHSHTLSHLSWSEPQIEDDNVVTVGLPNGSDRLSEILHEDGVTVENVDDFRGL